ncbi:unnamed protein product, partial [Rotaria magnacalcarata]
QRQLQHQLYTSSTLPTPASTYQTPYVQPSTSFQHQQLPPKTTLLLSAPRDAPTSMLPTANQLVS